MIVAAVSVVDEAMEVRVGGVVSGPVSTYSYAPMSQTEP